MGYPYRTIDGSNNNATNPNYGQAGTPLIRITEDAYEDGLSAPRVEAVSGLPLPSARAISNAVSSQNSSIPNSLNATDWIWQWGQFLDHDIDLTEAAHPAEPFNIAVPRGDSHFDPMNTGNQAIGLNRSEYINVNGIRQQTNGITAFIDASNVYGSDLIRADELRTKNGKGTLRTSLGRNGEILLPFNKNGLPNAGGPSGDLFIAGDVRANEQVGLTASHTLFVREHNRLAADLKDRLKSGDAILINKLNDSGLSRGDFIYESTRKVVGAQIQKITYEEWLPAVLGQDFLKEYTGYDETIDPSISNEFSTAAFRFGHTLLSPQINRADGDGNVTGNISLQNAFFNPSEIKNNGVDSLLFGLTTQTAQEVDTFLVDDVRNFLFGPPGTGGFDLASLNIQRGRDHGLLGYNDTREMLGLNSVVNFLDLAGGDAALADAFASVYDSVDDVDLWNGGLAETHINGGLLGETFSEIVTDQFLRLRDGDRYFYLRELDHISTLDPNFQTNTSLYDIIARNTAGETTLSTNVFRATNPVPEPSTFILVGLGFAGLFALARRRSNRTS